MPFAFTNVNWLGNVWSDIKIETQKDKNNYCNNYGFCKDKDDDSIMKMRYQLNNFFEIKPDFFQKRYLINGVNKDYLN